jgi:tetratricopeptide (TPR) repeat protein
MRKVLIAIIILFGFAQLLMAQNRNVDSLFNLLNKVRHDTSQFNIYIEIGNYFQNINSDSAIYFHILAEKTAKQIAGIEGELYVLEAIYELSWDNYLKNNYNRAIELYEYSIAVLEKYIKSRNTKIREKALKLYTSNFGNIAILYEDQANYAKALDYYFKSLKINEEIGYEKGKASNFVNIGGVFCEQGDHVKALDYYFKALKIYEEIYDYQYQSIALGGIGTVYNELEQYSLALDYYFKSLKIDEYLGNKNGQATKLGNIGIVYLGKGDSITALEYFYRALKLNEEINNRGGQAINVGNLGKVYSSLKQYSIAEEYLKNAERINRELGALYYLKYDCYSLSELYEKTNRSKEALYYYKEYLKYRDSLNNEENQKALVQKEMQYEYDKKEATLKAEQEKKDAITKADKQRQQLFMLLIGAVAAAIAIIALLVYRSLTFTKKQKQIIEQQKHLVEEKQKEILDSIHYAKRIQMALLTGEYYIDKHIKRLKN